MNLCSRFRRLVLMLRGLFKRCYLIWTAAEADSFQAMLKINILRVFAFCRWGIEAIVPLPELRVAVS